MGKKDGIIRKTYHCLIQNCPHCPSKKFNSMALPYFYQVISWWNLLLIQRTWKHLHLPSLGFTLILFSWLDIVFICLTSQLFNSFEYLIFIKNVGKNYVGTEHKIIEQSNVWSSSILYKNYISIFTNLKFV